jgi:outer membrane protein OmpA-like peptidoglycan-associated protein
VHALGSFDRTVHFAFDSAELTADARKELHEVAKCLTDPRTINLNIIINGHTDAVGSDDRDLIGRYVDRVIVKPRRFH